MGGFSSNVHRLSLGKIAMMIRFGDFVFVGHRKTLICEIFLKTEMSLDPLA